MSETTQEQSVVAVYDSHAAAEAVKELQKAGLDMKRLSIVGMLIPANNRNPKT